VSSALPGRVPRTVELEFTTSSQTWIAERIELRFPAAYQLYEPRAVGTTLQDIGGTRQNVHANSTVEYNVQTNVVALTIRGADSPRGTFVVTLDGIELPSAAGRTANVTAVTPDESIEMLGVELLADGTFRNKHQLSRVLRVSLLTHHLYLLFTRT
jgi:hypothetical protein